MDIEKSSVNGDRLIRGYASTADKDRQDESIIQKGLDISDFVTSGYFNYDHDNAVILGYPSANCKVDEKGFYVEGTILKGIPEADRIWDLALALKKSNAPRRIGFSVEGRVLQRDKGRVVKAKIYNVAITTNPVNTNCTWEAVAKSFDDMEEIQFDPIHKALEAGHEIDPENMEGGETFIKEDLGKDLVNLSYVIGDEKKKKILKEKLVTKKSLTSRQLTLYLQVAEGWSRAESENFISKQKLTGGVE
jgi:phage head maturation protease